MSRVAERVREPLRALRDVFRNPNLRRVQLAWVGSITGQYAYSIALAVYAYRQGGAAAVGLVIVVRMLPAAVVSPFAAVLADRGRRERVMVASDLVRAAALVGSAALIAVEGPAPAVYGLAVVVTVVGTVFHPAQAALLPSLARSPEELTANNVASSTIESVGSFAGPAIGGLVLAATTTWAAFLVGAGALLWSAALVLRIRPDRPPVQAPERERTSLRSEGLAGFGTILRNGDLRTIVGLYAAQTVVAGALGVLVVVLALDLLDLGNVGLGYLNSAIGIGGLVGAAVALALAARQRLAADFGFGNLLWGLPLVVLGIWPNPVAALVLLAVVGVGNTLVDVAALTLLQRNVDDAVLARVFGVVEGLCVATMAVGAVAAPVLVSLFGIRVTLIATGIALPLLVVVLRSRLAAIDSRGQAPVRELELLRGSPIFAPLPAVTLERLARGAARLRIAAGADVIRAGEAGDLFYVVESGQAEVLADSGVRVLGPGDSFGEIALLRDVPRTATVRAVTELELLSVGRDEFVAAVTGYAASKEAADSVIVERLGALRAGVAYR